MKFNLKIRIQSKRWRWSLKICKGVGLVRANLKSKNRILVIDDESDITVTLEQILKGEGSKLTHLMTLIQPYLRRVSQRDS